jgi:polyhydroxyalkanoate synthesis regulator phasin
MTTLDDVRKTIEATIGTITPSRAQEVARGFMEPGAAKEQVAKAAADLIEWSQRSRDRMRDFVRREIAEQMRAVGVATQSDLDAVKKRVRDLERAAGMTAAGRAGSTASGRARAKKPAARKRTTAKSAARSSTANRSATAAPPARPAASA